MKFGIVFLLVILICMGIGYIVALAGRKHFNSVPVPVYKKVSHLH